MAASLSDGRSKIRFPSVCQDALATLRAVESYGAEVERRRRDFFIIGSERVKTPEDVVHCAESAATIRFIAPILALADGISVLTGAPSLRRRPMGPLLKALKELGVECFSARGDGRPPIIIFGGRGFGGKASLPGNVSSQFVSGLLFASPLANEDVEITLSSPLESKPYVKMTINVLAKHGVSILHSGNMGSYRIPSNQTYKPSNHEVPGDYSSSAFLLAAAAITNSKVRIKGLKFPSLQADSAIVEILRNTGAQVKVGEGWIEVVGGSTLTGIEWNARHTPDLVPILAILGCFAEGETKIYHVERLRFKESDRIESLRLELAKMGGKLTFREGTLKVKGVKKLKGAVINPHGDHRIAMACSIAALRAEGETKILTPRCVRKSYPNFFKDLEKLGGKIAWK